MNKKMLMVCLGLSLQGCNGDDIEFLNSSDQLDTSEMYVNISADVRQRSNLANTALEDFTALQVQFLEFDRDGFFHSVELEPDDQISANVIGETASLVKQGFPSNNDPMAVRYVQEYPVSDAATPFSVLLDRDRDPQLHEILFNLLEVTPFSVSASEMGAALQDALIVTWSALPDTHYSLQFVVSCKYNNEPLHIVLDYPTKDSEALESPFEWQPAEHLTTADGLSDCTLTTALTGTRIETRDNSAFAALQITTSRRQAIVRLLSLE